MTVLFEYFDPVIDISLVFVLQFCSYKAMYQKALLQWSCSHKFLVMLVHSIPCRFYLFCDCLYHCKINDYIRTKLGKGIYFYMLFICTEFRDAWRLLYKVCKEIISWRSLRRKWSFYCLYLTSVQSKFNQVLMQCALGEF